MPKGKKQNGVEFRLVIRLGNAAMQNGLDLAWAIRNVTTRLENEIATDDAAKHCDDEHRIMDVNGNAVGTWGLYERT